MHNPTDTLWSKLVKDRDQWQCQVMGCDDDRLAAHHVEGKRKHSTRWMLDNGITLCVNHHTGSSDFSAHLTPKKFKVWFAYVFPERWEAIRQTVRIIMSEKHAKEAFMKLVK